jgi:HK97 family phage major capsid protein
MLAGYSVKLDPNMPNIGADAYPIMFGDFKRGYQIVDRLALAILRDPFTYARKNLVEFVGRKRVGGQVKQAEALAKLKIAV